MRAGPARRRTERLGPASRAARAAAASSGARGPGRRFAVRRRAGARWWRDESAPSRRPAARGRGRPDAARSSSCRRGRAGQQHAGVHQRCSDAPCIGSSSGCAASVIPTRYSTTELRRHLVRVDQDTRCQRPPGRARWRPGQAPARQRRVVDAPTGRGPGLAQQTVGRGRRFGRRPSRNVSSEQRRLDARRTVQRTPGPAGGTGPGTAQSP